jgi:hypothetical protein
LSRLRATDRGGRVVRVLRDEHRGAAPERLENLGGHWSPDRSRTEQAAFRAGLVRLHGEQCNAGMPHLAEWFPGLTRRCPRTSGLQAHHGKSGMPDALLCREHHGAVDEHAR